MKTALQEVIQWTIENAFNVQAQDGSNYIAIDHEEMRLKFDEWVKKEREQIAESFNEGYRAGNYDRGTSGIEYYAEKFGDVVLGCR